MKSLRIFFFSLAFFALIFYVFDGSQVYSIIMCASLIVALVFKGYEHETPQEAQRIRHLQSYERNEHE